MDRVAAIESCGPGKFEMILVRSQYLSDRTLYDNESRIVGKRSFEASFRSSLKKNRAKRVCTPTPENKLDHLGEKLDLLGERLPTRSNFSLLARSCLLKVFT